VNHDVYRLMYKEDVYSVAYERIKSKPGNMTPATGSGPTIAATRHYKSFEKNGEASTGLSKGISGPASTNSITTSW
jgi:hypothetical protein